MDLPRIVILVYRTVHAIERKLIGKELTGELAVVSFDKDGV